MDLTDHENIGVCELSSGVQNDSLIENLNPLKMVSEKFREEIDSWNVFQVDPDRTLKKFSDGFCILICDFNRDSVPTKVLNELPDCRGPIRLQSESFRCE